MDTQPPIEDVLDDLIPDWREQTLRLRDEGKSDAEITAEFQRQIKAQIDPLLDLYNMFGPED
jgi:hypothetical protein